MALINGGEMIVRALEKVGVKQAFALSGGHIDPIFQSCADHGINIFDVRHEAAATHAADGYARATGKPGVAFVTAGPGVANAVTGVANAYMDAVPMICIAGRSPIRDEDKLSLQTMNQIGLMQPVTKFCRTILHAERIPEYMAMAWRHAVSGRPGPVFLEIPIDILYTPVEEDDLPPIQNFEPEGRPAASTSSIDKALQELSNADRPVIVAGGGVNFSDASDALRQFAELTRIPVCLNMKARGAVNEKTDLGFGNVQVLASPEAADLAGGPPDVVMLMGARVGMFTGMGALGGPLIFPPGAKVIQLDIEAEEIGRAHEIDLGLVGDLNETLQQMIERAEGLTFRDHEPWITALNTVADAGRSRWDADAAASQPIHQARLMKEICGFLDDDAIIANDGGETQLWMAGVAQVENLRNYLGIGYLGCLGVGLPFAMAAKIANPARQVLCITGDGSAGLNFSEFDTLVRHNIPVVVVVNNDQGWGMIRHGHIRNYERVVGAELGATRYDLVAEGWGAHAELVTRSEDIQPALQRAFASGKPACINVMTDPTQPFGARHDAETARKAREEALETKEFELPYYGKRKLGPDG